MFNSIRAGFFYFATVFGLGFILGTIRVLVLIPRLGELISTLIELPVILSAAWFICRQLTARFQVPQEWSARLRMGVSAFVLLMGTDLALSVWLFGNTVTGHFERYRLRPNAIGLAGQVVFLLFPLLQMENPDQAIQAGDS